MAKHRGRHKAKTQVVEGWNVREVRPGYWLVDRMISGKRIRKAFSALSEAETYCRMKAVELTNRGTAALDLPDAVRHDALEALRILEGTGASLRTVAEYYAKRHPSRAGETLRQTCDRYLAEMAEGGRRDASLKDKRWKLAALCVALGDRPAASVDASDLAAWTKGRGWAEGTARAYRGAAETVLRFAAGTAKRRQRSVDSKPPATWDVETVSRLFAKAETEAPGVVPAFAVLFFAGLRPTEMMRLTWGDIDLAAGLIRLQGAQTKTRDMRNVEIAPNLLAWLTQYRGEGALVAGATAYRAMRERAMGASGVDTWPVDVARHTFATMHYHLHDDAAKTASQLGHFGSSQTFARFYKGCPVTARDAKRFFEIKPSMEAHRKPPSKKKMQQEVDESA